MSIILAFSLFYYLSRSALARSRFILQYIGCIHTPHTAHLKVRTVAHRQKNIQTCHFKCVQGVKRKHTITEFCDTLYISGDKLFHISWFLCLFVLHVFHLKPGLVSAKTKMSFIDFTSKQNECFTEIFEPTVS